MDEKQSPANKGYQKQIKKEEAPVQPKKASPADYASPMAKKWPVLRDALEKGDLEAVKKAAEEGMNLNNAHGGVTPLMIAASKGHVEVVGFLLESGVNINEKNDDNRTALHVAVTDQAGTAVVDLLLESGIAVDAKDRGEKTALMLAEETKKADIVKAIKRFQGRKEEDAREWKVFLDSSDGKPYKANYQLEFLNTYANFWYVPLAALSVPGLLFGFFFGFVKSLTAGLVCGGLFIGGYHLRMMMLRNYLDAFGPLPELNIDLLREKKKRGESLTLQKTGKSSPEPIIAANAGSASADSFTAAKVISAKPAPAPEGRRARVISASSSAVKTVDLKNVIIAAVAIVLIAAAAAGFVYRSAISTRYYAKKLERRGFAVTGAAFFDAVSQRDTESIALFFKAGIAGTETNEQGQTALIIAAEKGHDDLIGLLAACDRNLLTQPDAAGMTPLMTSAVRGRARTVQALVEAGADVNQIVSGREGAVTALQAVADAPEFKEEHLRTAKYLLGKGADAKVRNAAGQSALQFAASHGRVDLALLLKEEGVDMNDADAQGATPAQAAACEGHADFLTFLADQGADLQKAASDGQFPLLCAARKGHAAAVRMLLSRGVDPDRRTAQGISALTEASLAGNLEIAKALLEWGADPAAGLPEPFRTLEGKPVAIAAKKKSMRDVLKSIATAAAADGYAMRVDGAANQKVTMTVKGPWNQVLEQVAVKNGLFVIVKEKEVVIIPPSPSWRKKART